MTEMTNVNGIKIEEKLYQNRYLVDEGRPHIEIKNPDYCMTKCKTNQACTFVCPAQCYTKEEDSNRVILITDGCLECGTCRVVCAENDNLIWDYPRGGYGIQYKFG